MAKQKHDKATEKIDDTVHDENVTESTDGQNEELQKKVEEAEAQVLEYKNHYLRALADYKNLEHRVNNDRERMRSMIQKQTIEKFLPIVDNLDQAEVFMQDPGLKMINSAFRQTLKELGFQEIELLGQEYDPHFSEVVDVVEGKENDSIVEVLQKAYSLNGEVIRPGKVKVTRSTESK